MDLYAFFLVTFFKSLPTISSFYQGLSRNTPGSAHLHCFIHFVPPHLTTTNKMYVKHLPPHVVGGGSFQKQTSKTSQ